VCLSGHCCHFITDVKPVPGTELETADRLGVLSYFICHTFCMGVTPGLSIAGYVITEKVESNRTLESWEEGKHTERVESNQVRPYLVGF
jgi:hypothetical protein